MLNNDITILTVDDTETNIDILLGILDQYDVIPALDGKSALEIAFSEKVDLILLDIMMPNMDGFEVCKQLKSDPRTKDIPIIYLTAKNDDDSIQKAYESGGVDYISKPFRPIELVSRVKNHIKLNRHRKEAIKHNKLIALNELINNIAHQWRQPLSSISTAASGLKLQHELGMLEESMLGTYTDQIVNECNYLSSIIETFKDLIEDSEEKIVFNLKELLDHNKNLITTGLQSCDIVDSIVIEDSINIKGSSVQLLQALMHIITNAHDALCLKEQDTKLILLNGYVKDDTAVIEIIDNAGGLDSSIVDNIFEPYFTTKHQSQGKGLGLYTVHKIIKEYFRGDVSASNITFDHKGEKQTGANITISIPITK